MISLHGYAKTLDLAQVLRHKLASCVQQQIYSRSQRETARSVEARLNLLVAVAERRLHFGSLLLFGNDYWFVGRSHLTMITHALVVAQIPGQGPVIWRDYSDARISSLVRALGDLVYFFNQFQRLSSRVG